jgi:hypothetical protein
MSEIEDIFSSLMKPLQDMPKELQTSNIFLTLAVAGINNCMTPKMVVDYFYEVVNLMKTHKKTK